MMSDYNTDPVFSPGDPAPAAYFTGQAWLKLLLPDNPELHCQIGNVIFEPGTRNHWHTHPGGQILIVTAGTGYYQEKGKPIQLIQKGDVIKILPGIIHWHGASRDAAMTHLAINPNTTDGMVNWLHPVSDEEYGSYQPV